MHMRPRLQCSVAISSCLLAYLCLVIQPSQSVVRGRVAVADLVACAVVVVVVAAGLLFVVSEIAVE